MDAALAASYDKVPHWKRMLARIALNVMALMLAVLVPGISDLISIGSAAAVSYMCFILVPALYMYVVLRRDEPSVSRTIRFVACCVCIVFGVCAGTLTTYFSVVNVINHYQEYGFDICSAS